MKSKLTKLITSIAMMLAISLPSFAHEFEVDGIYYSILSSTKKTVYVTYRGNSYDSYTNEYTGSVTIPSTVTYSGKTYSVTSIGESAFANCSGLTSVTIPDSVTEIGGGAFANCSGLTSVTIPNSVTSIGYDAFSVCSGLKSVTIGNSVTSIGYAAFANCSGLTSVTIPNSVTSIGYAAFANCSGLTSVTIPNSVTSIENYAFSGCSGLTSVTIPNSVTSIGNYAFYNCSGLTSVTIPNSVTAIGEYAFEYCYGLTSVTIGNSVSSIGSDAFYDCTKLYQVINLSKLSLTKGSTKHGYVAYYASIIINAPNGIINGDFIWSRSEVDDVNKLARYLGAASELILPDDYNGENYVIGNSAFYACSSLTSVTIGNSVTSIGEYAFAYCSGLTSVTIPNSVTSIGYAAFAYCSGLTSVTIPNSVTSIGDQAFRGCSGLTEVSIPNSVSSIGYAAFAYCSGLTSVTIGNSVTSIGEYAFYECSGLTEVSIGNSVTSIGAGAFRYCIGLTEVSIPNSVTSIGSSAFSGCSGLTSVTIGNSVTSIGEYAFYECSGLTSVTIPNSVTSIGYAAFAYCSGLTEVTIPNSVTSIGEGAFYECSGLTEVNYNAKNLLKVGSYTNLSYAKIIIVGEDVETIPAGIIDSSAATTIISKNTIPPVCDSNAFSSVNKSKCTLYVPVTSLVDYWSAEVWKEFTNIKPFIETTSITFDAENYKIGTGESLQINANITPNEASIMDLIWTSSNPEVATVSSTGKVVGIKLGEATITARTIDGSNLAASCTITVETTLAESIKLSQTEVELAPYETVVLTYTILPQNTTNKSVTWSSSDESIATFKVNNDGSATVLMLKDDKAVITVTTNDGSNLSASCIVGKISGVEDVYVEEVAVTAEDGEIVVKNVTGIVTVYNLTGIAVASETADGNEVRFDNLQPGVYIVVVNNKSVKVVL